MQLTKGEHSGLCIALTEKAGFTSISQTLKHARIGRRLTVRDAKNRRLPCRIYLRHPLTRLASAWAYFRRVGTFPQRTVPRECPFERFVDEILDRQCWNEHWGPQLDLYRGCNIVDIFRFEDINDTWPGNEFAPRGSLRHLNAGRYPKPEINYRVEQLCDYYRDDLDAWDAGKGN